MFTSVLFIGNLPYSATEAELREHLSAVGVPASLLCSPSIAKQVVRRGFAFVDYTRIAASPKRPSSDSISNHSRDARSRSRRPVRARSAAPAGRGPADLAAPHGREGSVDRGQVDRWEVPHDRAASAVRGRSSPARPARGSELRARRPPQAQAQAAQGAERARPKRPDQTATGLEPLRRRRRWRSLDAKEEEPDIDNVATHKDRRGKPRRRIGAAWAPSYLRGRLCNCRAAPPPPCRAVNPAAHSSRPSAAHRTSTGRGCISIGLPSRRDDPRARQAQRRAVDQRARSTCR